MTDDFDFIIHAIVQLSQMNYREGLERGNTVSLVAEDDDVRVYIKRSLDDPEEAALVTAVVDGEEREENIFKGILYDILGRTGLLDSKLNMKLDIVLNNRKMKIENGRIVLE